MSRDLPIPFSSPMSSAILAGRKTQTRREIKWLDGNLKPKPQFAIGDRLWVREFYYQFGHWIPQGRTKTDRVKWAFKPGGQPTFDAPEVYHKSRVKGLEHFALWYARLGRFMPRAYSRTTLTVTGVKVERLQDISEADCFAEGVGETDFYDNAESKVSAGAPWVAERLAYADLWTSINGAGSWEVNPWVAAYTFAVEKRNIDDGR